MLKMTFMTPLNNPGTFKNRSTFREKVLNWIQSALEKLSAAITLHTIPVLVLYTRTNKRSLVYYENTSLSLKKMRTSQFKFPSETFQIYKAVLHDLFSGLKNDIVSTKRDIYYRNVDLYKTQNRVDKAIDDIACTLRIPRHCLNVVAGAKGLVAGNLSFLMKSGQTNECRIDSEQGKVHF